MLLLVVNVGVLKWTILTVLVANIEPSYLTINGRSWLLTWDPFNGPVVFILINNMRPSYWTSCVNVGCVLWDPLVRPVLSALIA